MDSPLQRTMDGEEQQVCVDILSGNEVRAESDDHEEINILKEKRKPTGGSSGKKPPRPPQTQRAFSVDVADQKLMRELAMLKRARLERMRSLILQKKPTKASSSSPSSFFAMIFTVIVFVVLLFQGMSCQISCGTFQGSPPPLQPNETALIFIPEEFSPSAHDSV